VLDVANSSVFTSSFKALWNFEAACHTNEKSNCGPEYPLPYSYAVYGATWDTLKTQNGRRSPSFARAIFEP